MMVTCKKTKRGWDGTVIENKKIIATFELERQDDYMAIHNVIYLWTPRVFKIYKDIFELIKKGVKLSGCKFICTGCHRIDNWRKMEKYWRMMGFNVFVDGEWEGQPIKTAVMEL